jgi:hypothetical protein
VDLGADKRSFAAIAESAQVDNLYRLLGTKPQPRGLDPDDIRVVAAAYEATLRDLKVEPGDAATRARVASHIIEDAMLGERDPLRLRDHAVAREPTTERAISDRN